MKSKAVWITWESQVRNRSLSRALDVELLEFSYSGARFMRYLVNLVRTIWALAARRPRVVFAPNPSVVLTLLLLHLKWVFRYRYVVDAHFIGVMAFEKGEKFQKVLDYCNRRADTVIVTNDKHAEHVREIGGNPFVCEDPLPDFPSDIVGIEDGMDRSVLFVCSFDSDEPYNQVFRAATELVEASFTMYVSGNFRRAGIDPKDYPQVTFLGYVSSTEFYSYVTSVDVILDLTTAENCLVCGAYEAMEAEKPLVTSKTKALRSYFTHGTVFTNHKPAHIASSIEHAFENRQRLSSEIRDWKFAAQVCLSEKLDVLRQSVGI